MADSPPSTGRDLKSWLATLFEKNGGAISFERFMAEALYHPDFGYYTHHIRTVGGSRGDFATSATLSELLGEAIAEWVERETVTNALKKPVHLIEIGGGEGSLMKAVISALDARSGFWRRNRFRFHLVEISPRLRERQRETLRPWRRRIRWHDTVEEAIAETAGEALLYSNELVDAFPAIALRHEGNGKWSELFVEFHPERGLRETYRPLTESRPDLDRDHFSVFAKTDWPVGQRVELHASFRDWQRAWMSGLKRGASLVIDYGANDPTEIYDRRLEGTLRAFFRHQRLTGAGIYRMFGKQDLTADVCFQDIARWGEAAGWETTLDQTQSEFLCKFAGPACAAAAETDRSAAFLLEPDGAGEAFRVLGQRTIDAGE